MAEDVQSSQVGPRAGAEPLSNVFRGGILIALAALALLGLTFTISSPLVPRVLAIALGLVGVATAAGMVPVRAPQDYYGGIILVMLATLAFIASAELPGQRGFAFGPGTAPRLFAAVLCLLGGAVAVMGVTSDGPRIEKYKLRGPVFVMAAIVLFACIIRPFGLVVSSFIVFMLSIMGSTEIRWIESMAAAAAMTGLCVGLFVYLLNLPFQLWPQANAHELLFHQFVEFFRLVFGPLLKFIGVV